MATSTPTAGPVDKQPIAAFEDRAFAREARTIESSTFVAHVRFASTGALERRNTHPFEQNGRLFAHNGVVQDLPSLEQRLGKGMDLVHGDTDSERLFALISTEIDNHDGDVEAGIATAIQWVAANLPILSVNFVMIAPNELWALRYPDVTNFTCSSGRRALRCIRSRATARRSTPTMARSTTPSWSPPSCSMTTPAGGR